MVKKESNKIGNKDVLNRFLNQNDKLIEYISRIDKTLEVLNDQNTLHIKALEDNRVAINDNKTAIENSANVNKTVTRLFAFLLILQAAAIIVLAGAEKALQYFNFKGLPTP